MTASVSVTERTRIRRKISIRHQVADTDQTRVAETRCPESRKHFRSLLRSRNTYLAHSADYEQITVSTVPAQPEE